MDERLLGWLVGGLVTAVSTAFFVLFFKHRSRVTKPVLPPGRVGYPLIGETIQWLSSGWKGHPEKFIFDRMTRFNTDIFKTSLIGEPVAVFCGAACNKFLFSNENKLVQLWWPSFLKKIFGGLPLASSGQEEAMKLRMLLPNFIKPEALQRYVGPMDIIAQRCFAADWEGQSQIETLKLAKRYTLCVSAKLFLNLLSPEDIVRFEHPLELISAGVLGMPIDFPGMSFRKAINASKFMQKELVKIIKQRRLDLADGSASTQDILSHMLLVGTDEGMHITEQDIALKIIRILVASHDTVGITNTFIVKYLAELPRVYDAVYKEQMEIAKAKGKGELLTWEDLRKMKYSWNVVQEVLRLVPPLQGTFREALTDFKFKGYSIPKGWKLYWNANSTHLNADYFPEPHKFDPTRFEGNGPAPFTYVPFGGGPRMCPGNEYARVEILVFMHNLVCRFRWEKIIPNEGIVVAPLPVPANGLPVRLFPHTQVA